MHQNIKLTRSGTSQVFFRKKKTKIDALDVFKGAAKKFFCGRTIKRAKRLPLSKIVYNFMNFPNLANEVLFTREI